MKRYMALVLLFFAASVSGLRAQKNADITSLADDTAKASTEQIENEKNKKFDFSFHGYVRANIVAGTKDVNKYDMKEDSNKFNNGIESFKNGIDLKKGGAIVQFQLEGYASDVAHFYSATNLELDLVKLYSLDDARLTDDDGNVVKDKKYLEGIEDYLDPLPFLKFVEAYIDLYPARWMSIRMGKQIITWGEIEGIEAPTDILTPWDYTTKSSVFEDARIGILAAAANFFFFNQKFEIVWCPIPQPSKLPYIDTLNKSIINGYQIIPRVQRPPVEIQNGEYAARLSGTIGNNFRYGAAFLYGFDDLPDSKIYYPVVFNGTELVPDVSESTMRAYLLYHRVMVPAIDLAYDIKDVVAIKASSVMQITKDFKGKRDDYRNSYVKYLVGVESTNIGADIYFAMYLGQHWIINYTREHGTRSMPGGAGDVGNVTAHNLIPNKDMMAGFDEEYRYKWLVSCLIQRSFLQHKNFDIGLRWALSASPNWDDIDYAVNLNFQYRIADGVSTTLGIIAANKIDVVKNLLLLELQYSF